MSASARSTKLVETKLPLSGTEAGKGEEEGNPPHLGPHLCTVLYNCNLLLIYNNVHITDQGSTKVQTSWQQSLNFLRKCVISNQILDFNSFSISECTPPCLIFLTYLINSFLKA